MSYSPIPAVNNRNQLVRTNSSIAIRKPIFKLFEDILKCQHHSIPINASENKLFKTLVFSFQTNTTSEKKYTINNTDSPLIKLLKHISNRNPIESLDVNIYLAAMRDLLYIYNGCKDCVTCVKYYALPNMKESGILPIFQQVIEYLIKHKPDITANSNRKIFSALTRKYLTYKINENVEYLNNLNVTSIEDIELYRKLYAVEREAFESLISINPELRILYIGSGWAPPKYQGTIIYQFPLLLHGYIPDNIFREVYKTEFNEHRKFRDEVLKKHITTIDISNAEKPDEIVSNNEYTTSSKFDIIIQNTFFLGNGIYEYFIDKYKEFLTQNGCILTYFDQLPFNMQYIMIRQLEKKSLNKTSNNNNNVLNKKKKGQKSIIQMFKHRGLIPNNNTVENIFRMTNSFNEIKFSNFGYDYMLYYECSDISLLIQPASSSPPLILTMKNLLQVVFKNENNKSTKYISILGNSLNSSFENGNIERNEIDAYTKIPLEDRNRIYDELNALGKTVYAFGGGKKEYIKLQSGGKRLIRYGKRGGKYYIKNNKKVYFS